MIVERKTAPALLKSLDDKGAGVAVIATLGVVDRDGDVTQAGAFGEQTVPVVFAHDWHQPAIGKANIRESEGEALAEFKLNLKTERGKEVYEALRFDLENPPAKQQWSYGFSIPPGGAEFLLEDGQRVRVLKRLLVHEVSPVVAGAGIATRTLALKSGASEEEREALRAHLQGLPLAQREALLAQMRAWTAEARFTLLSMDFDDLFDGKGAFRYIYVEPWDGRAILAAKVAAAACTELGIGFPKSVRFFTPTDEARADFMHVPNLSGLCSKNGVISLAWELGPEEFVLVAAHEAAHLAHMDEDAADAFAEKFARRHSAKLLGIQPTVNPLEVLWAMSVMKKWYGPVVPYVHI